MAWGGSISQVAQNEITLGAQQRAAAERQLEMLIQQHQEAQKNAQQTRQLDQHDAAQSQQQRQFDTSQAADAAKEGRLGKQFDINVGLTREEMAQRAAERTGEADWRRKVFTMNESDRQVKELLPYAQRMAEEGMFGTTEDVIKHFPTLASQAPMIAANSLASRRKMEAASNAEQSDADVLNNGPADAARYNNMAAQERNASWDSSRNHWWKPNEPDTAAIDEWGQRATAITGAANAVRSDRNRMGQLQPDATGRYRPVTNLPWRSSGTASSGGPAVPVNTQFKPGMMVIQGGTTYRFDGQNWQPLR